MEEWIRSEMLLGSGAVETLRESKVAVFGIGGVGSYAAEALARSGIGRLVFVDHDVVSVSNINRQLVALHSTVGRFKAEVMRERALDINPQAEITVEKQFFLPDLPVPYLEDCDYIVDAIDTVSGKIALAELARERQIPIVAAMGCGNKRDPSRFEVSDLFHTSVCPLCRVMRRELRQRGFRRYQVVYSKEEPQKPSFDPEPGEGRRTPGSLPFVPASAGLLLAGAVVEGLTVRQ